VTGLRHDGTFDGLLCALDEALLSGLTRVLAPEDPPLFLEEAVRTDGGRARRFTARLVAASGTEAVRRLWLASLAGASGDLLSAYCRRAFVLGRALADDHGQDEVRQVHRLARAASVEAHRLAGFLRFARRGEVWYAPCEPDFAVLPIVGNHIARRFPDSDRIVHDLRRERAALCRGGRFSLVPLARPTSPVEDDEAFPRLWRTYFRAVTNEARRNEVLQRSRMPRRYWEHLVEDPEGGDDVSGKGC
jgi:probable DNA metabolism protein